MLDHLQLARLCRSMGLLLHGGFRLADSAFLLAQEETSALKELLTNMGTQMDSGRSLSEAMEESGVFPPYVFRLIRIGEETGRVEEALNGLADYYEEQHRAGCQIRSAVAYPSLILVLMMAVVGVLLVKVLPVFDQVYASLGTQMTGAAVGLLYLGQLLKKAMPVLFALLAVLVAAALAYRWVASFREWGNRWFRNRFGDRGAARKFNNARFAQGLSMGLSSGLPLEEAAELAADLLENIPGAARRCRHCRKALAEGSSIRDAMDAGMLLSPVQSRMLSLGLQGGNGDSVMQNIAEQMMEDAKAELDAMVSRIEPAMVLVSSLLVGMILLAVMLPLLDILSVLG